MLPLDSAAGTPREVWGDYFSKRKPRPSDVSDLVLQLHNKGKHEHVIAAIEAALVHGQSQPWMYDVLALSMRIAKRPQDEIERVLLSRVDFSLADVPSMLYSAAYLTRFGGDESALTLYRQASRLAPNRPEPYVLGLKLACRQRDYDAIRWAAVGILTTAWTRDHRRLHQQAEDAVLDACKQLERSGRSDEAAALKQAIDEARKKDLILKLTWSGVGDLDLIVEEPSGTICSFGNPQSPGGGVLVHDGYGPLQANCYEEYVCPLGIPGDYRVRIRHSWGNIVGKRAQLTVIRYQGTSRESTRRFTVLLAKRDRIVRVSLPKGRRKELALVRKPEVVRGKRRPASLLQQMQRLNFGSQRAGRDFSESRRRADLAQRGSAAGVGFQPVISVLSEGVSMSALAVVSGDRRYVRITTSPAISAITDVFTFSFINNGGNPTGNPGLGGGGNR